MTTRFKRWIGNRDTLIMFFFLIVSLFIVVKYYIFNFYESANLLIAEYDESIWTGMFVTIFVLIPPFLLVFLPIKIIKWWKESAKW